METTSRSVRRLHQSYSRRLPPGGGRRQASSIRVASKTPSGGSKCAAHTAVTRLTTGLVCLPVLVPSLPALTPQENSRALQQSRPELAHVEKPPLPAGCVVANARTLSDLRRSLPVARCRAGSNWSSTTPTSAAATSGVRDRRLVHARVRRASSHVWSGAWWQESGRRWPRDRHWSRSCATGSELRGHKRPRGKATSDRP